MNFHKMALLSLSVLAIAGTSETFSQTCKVKTATLNDGRAVYTEVFEFDYVDEKPEFPGGCCSMVNFINSKREYPQEAYDMGIEGRVTCCFVVNPNGKISNIQVIRGVESSLNREAIRVVSLMPDWTPGKIKDTAVPVRVVCSIPFRK